MGHYFKWLGSSEQARKLWENQEALDKYLARLEELMEKDSVSSKDKELILSPGQTFTMAIRAKFRCNSVTDNGYGLNATLTAVYGKEGENADYAKATPSGTLQINIDKETKAAGFFTPMKEYYLDFTSAD